MCKNVTIISKNVTIICKKYTKTRYYYYFQYFYIFSKNIDLTFTALKNLFFNINNVEL
jgi:hypothetical protein